MNVINNYIPHYCVCDTFIEGYYMHYRLHVWSLKKMLKAYCCITITKHDMKYSLVIWAKKSFTFCECFRFLWDSRKCSMERKTKQPNQQVNLLIYSASKCNMHFYFRIIFFQSSHHVDLWLMTKPARLLSNLSTSNQYSKYILFTSLRVYTAFTWIEFYFRVLLRGKIYENVNYYFTLEAFQCIAITVVA